MRITNNTMIEDAKYNISKLSEQIAKYNKIATTGKKVDKPSDDPAGITKILNTNSHISSADQFLKNITAVKLKMNTNDSSLESAENLLIRAKEISIAQSTGTVSSEDRLASAKEVDGIILELVQIGNTKLGSQYIFSGTDTLTKPFSESGSYNGNSQQINVEIGEGVQVPVNVTGGKVFKGDGGGVDILQTLIDLKTALETNDVLSVAGKLSQIDQGLDQILRSRAEVGATINLLDNATSRLSNTKDNLTEILSGLQDADIVSAYSDLTLAQYALQGALAATAKIIQPSLLNYLD